jgi:hypothetical protein
LDKTTPSVFITYQGSPLTEQFYNAHPEIHHLYPAKEVFMERLYIPLLKKLQETNVEQVLEISEHSIRINGVEQ